MSLSFQASSSSSSTSSSASSTFSFYPTNQDEKSEDKQEELPLPSCDSKNMVYSPFWSQQFDHQVMKDKVDMLASLRSISIAVSSGYAVYVWSNPFELKEAQEEEEEEEELELNDVSFLPFTHVRFFFS